MTHKVYVATDLGPGDGGKGTMLHKIAKMIRAHTFIKRGGAQGSHGVCTSKGQKFAFSQWGCGTFEGIPTHLSRQMIVSPEGLLNEANALRYQHGIYDAFDLLTVDEEALCATPYDGIASRLKELARGDNPRGTVGTGVGEAYRTFQRTPELAIKAGDLKSPRLRELLANARGYVQADLKQTIEDGFSSNDQIAAAEDINLLNSDEFFEHVVQRFVQAGKLTTVVSSDFLAEVILKREGVAVVETSHGVLTDRLAGFHPHTSAIRTLPSFTHGMLNQTGFNGEIVNIGITRAYAIRHGAGPMPTADPGMTANLLPGSHKETNRYQGEVRVGALDFVLLRYALEVCGGPTKFNGLAVTWFDQIVSNKVWFVCNRYSGADDSAYFSPTGEIKVSGQFTPELQMALGHKLSDCRPEIDTIPLNPASSKEDLYGLCAQVVSERTAVPVRMVSFGPTELDKLYK